MQPTVDTVVVFEIASAADAVGNVLVGEDHFILRAHSTNHPTAGSAVVLSNQEGERKQADLALLDLVNKRIQ